MPRKTPKPEEATSTDEYRQSAVNLRKRDWELLSYVARARVAASGGVGRASVSKVLESLIGGARKSLEHEAGQVTNPWDTSNRSKR
jgi:hypothetical protein